MNPDLKRAVVIACAIIATIIFLLVLGDIGFAKDEPLKWLAVGGIATAIGLGVTQV